MQLRFFTFDVGDILSKKNGFTIFVKSKFEGKKKRKLLSLETPSPRTEDMKNG